MSRILKFRIFDGNDMVILENSGLQYFDFEGSFSLGFTVDGYSGFWLHECYPRLTKECSKYPIMQFTGALDIDKNEVFEGDIIEGFDGYKTVIATVVWNTMALSWRLDGVSSTNKQQATLKKLSNKKIIGNIYQNPELLKK